ncbi:MAG: transposase [Planctomycetes bacterium]|nr:transposase [Planctomycetota bacterium]
MQSNRWRCSDEFWAFVEPLLPVHVNEDPLGRGRPRQKDRKAMDAILFVARTGCQWNALNATGICSSSTAHRRFQEWTQAGVFLKLWQGGLEVYDELKGLNWSWQSMDGAMTKAPLGGGKNRPQPYGSSQIRYQAKSAHRGGRYSGRTGRGGSQRQRLQACAADDRKHSREKTAAVAAPAAKLVPGQRV